MQIPQGQLDLLPTNFFLSNLVSMVAFHGDSESRNLECDNCDNGDPAAHRCITCSHFLCEFCTQAHRRGRSTRLHTLKSLEEAIKMGSVAMTKPSVCGEHDGEVRKLFCETCEEAICRDCTILEHRDHKCSFVKNVFLKSKDNLEKILSEAKIKASELKETLDDVLEMNRSMHSCAEQTVQEVIDCFNKLTACVDVRREKLTRRVQDLKKAKL